MSTRAALPAPPALEPPRAPDRGATLGAFRRGVLSGLARRPRAIPSLYFYDAWGSRLFQRIMDLPEYYLTRCEREILEHHGAAIVGPLRGRPCTVVDLGAGDGAKTRLLLERLRGRTPRLAYAPVDVSAAALREAEERVAGAWPDLEVVPVEGEYAAGLRWLGERPESGALLVLFLGSSIGNLEAPEAARLLRELREALHPGDHVLVGFDLLKDRSTLRRAYDDSQGVTAAFNLNLLARINRELGADFDLSAFEHRATFDARRPAMESWLVATRRQVVTVAGTRFELEAGEAIHTEISCKYREEDVTAFARQAGFAEVGRFRDRRGWFLDALWRVGREQA